MGPDQGDDQQDSVWDIEADAEEQVYECLRCGWMARRSENPSICPECESTVRNRSMPIE